ncbi:MAG: ribosome maturation factor RimM [Magnetococcus sp. MYC-9]
MTNNATDWVAVGRLQGAFGVKGWVRITTFTDPPEHILSFADWWLGEESAIHSGAAIPQKVDRLAGRKHARGVVAHLHGVENPEAAQRLSGLDLWVPRSHLPDPEEGEHYWTDMIGAQVVTTEGEPLGVVDHLFATGANDVLVVREADGGERLLPFTREVVQTVDRHDRVITVCLMSGM